MNSTSKFAIALATILMMTAAANAQTESKTCCKGKGDKATCCKSANCNQDTVATATTVATDQSPAVASDGLSPTIECACCSESAMSPLVLALDIDKDGIVSAAEIKNATQSLLALDKNRDGKLDKAEMNSGIKGFSKVNASTKVSAKPKKKKKRSAMMAGTSANYFAQKMLEADANGNGVLDGAEISPKFLSVATDDAGQPIYPDHPNMRLIDIIDLDQNGSLSFAELKAMNDSLNEFHEANSSDGG